MTDKLTYKGFDIGISNCEKSSDCTCDFCKSCVFIIETMAALLGIIVDNKMVEAYHYLLLNCDQMFKKCHTELSIGDNGNGKTVH